MNYRLIANRVRCGKSKFAQEGMTLYKMLFQMLLLVFGVLTMTSFTTAQVKTQTPAVPEGVQMIADLEYVANGHPRQKLDLYLPKGAEYSVPVVLWVHGGGWAAGDKSRSPAVPLALRGYAVAAINYRFSQHAIFPAQIHDCKAAIRWLRSRSQQYGLDPQHIGAWGASAGGHLVALLGVTNGHRELEGKLGNLEHSSSVQAVVDWFGPTDFMTVGSQPTRTKLLGGEPKDKLQLAQLASPLQHVSSGDCPFLIMHGDKDKTVPISQSELLTEALSKAGVDATMVTITDGGHGGAKFNQELDRIDNFFSKYLKPSDRRK